MKIEFEVKELKGDRVKVDATFTNDDAEVKSLKSASTREFDETWKRELILCFVTEEEADEVEVTIL